MSHTPGTDRLRRLVLLLAAAAMLTGCAGSDALAPSRSQPPRIILAASTATPLASLGDTILITHSAVNAEGQPVSGIRFRWSVSPAGIVQEDSDGVFRAVGNGNATIVAELDTARTGVRPAGYWVGRLADSVVVSVQQIPARIVLTPVDSAFGMLGSSRQLHAQVTDARGNAMLAGPPPLIWHSADSSVVTVDSAGVVRSLGQGTARITVQAAELTGGTTFIVSAQMPFTSCMVFAQRLQTRKSCVTINFTMRARKAGS